MNVSSARLRIVIDTNLFVSSAISPIGAPRRLLEAGYDRRFFVLFSADQYHELIDVFRRPKLTALYRFSAREFAAFFTALDGADRVEPSPTVPVAVRDPDDILILAAALGGDADYLVTGDADLLVHRDDSRLGKLQIVTVSEFLTILDQKTIYSDTDR